MIFGGRIFCLRFAFFGATKTVRFWLGTVYAANPPGKLQGSYRQRKPNTNPHPHPLGIQTRTTQLLAINIRHFNLATNETFFAKMNEAGRITVSKINAEIIKAQISHCGCEIILSPK